MTATNRLSRGRLRLKLAEGLMLRRSRAGQASLPVLFLTFSLSAADTPKVTFLRDVAPILNKAGCTSGPCHGAAKGKNGFKLSLRGYDPQFDYETLLYDLSGRRFNRADPASSLMLAKPAQQIAHGGGLRFEPGSGYYDHLQLDRARRAVWRPRGRHGTEPAHR